MEAHRWTGPLSRIVPQDADNLDDLTSGFDVRRGLPGRDIFPDIAPALHCEGAFKRPDQVCVGLRVPATLADACDTAMRLASLAAEQDVEIIVFASCDVSGLERFGFRIERVAGAGQESRERCEQQIKRFWNVDLVL
jgi:hypothetical protein